MPVTKPDKMRELQKTFSKKILIINTFLLLLIEIINFLFF